MIGGALSLSVTGFATCQGARGCDRRQGREYEDEIASWMAAIRAMAGNGMWLVVRGYHLGDDIIAVATNSPLSHASVLDRERESVIEAVGKGVVETSLSSFLHDSHRMQIIQPEGWTPERGANAVARARSAIGKGYDYLGIVGAPSESAFYCSELALWSMGIRVDRFGPHRVFHPRHMDRFGRVLFDSHDRDGVPDY
jgi:hypothetical protein